MIVTDGHAVTVLVNELNADRVFGTGTWRAGAHRAVSSATGGVTDAALTAVNIGATGVSNFCATAQKSQ